MNNSSIKKKNIDSWDISISTAKKILMMSIENEDKMRLRWAIKILENESSNKSDDKVLASAIIKLAENKYIYERNYKKSSHLK